MIRVVIVALAASSCALVDTPLVGLVPDGSVPPLDAGDPPLDAGPDASSCEVDEDGDGSCAGVDCDDDNPRRAPGRPEYCPDRIDNDCDDNVDFADVCDALNDACDGPLAILRQAEDQDETFWQFDLPLDHYQDDVVAGLSAGSSEDDCLAGSGQNGHDAIFQIVTVADSVVEATATGTMSAVPILILQLQACGQGDEEDVCDAADDTAARVVARLGPDGEAWLVVDDAAASFAGSVRLEVRITRRVPH